MSMIDEARYLEERVDDQERWYDRKSTANQRWYKRLSILQIISAAVIPFLAGNLQEIPYANWIIGILGVVIAIGSASSSLYKFQENWIQYRTTCESIRHHKYLYLTKSPPYHGDDPFHLLVRNIEALISKENSDWGHYTAKELQPQQGGE